MTHFAKAVWQKLGILFTETYPIHKANERYSGYAKVFDKLLYRNYLHGTDICPLAGARGKIILDFSFGNVTIDLKFSDNLAFRIFGILFEDIRAARPTGPAADASITVYYDFHHFIHLHILF